MKISEALVFALKAMNVRYVFGVSGANIEHLHDAIGRQSNGELEAILSKSESGAAFMADAHARTHNTLGVCCATSGGGMFNLLPGLAEAYAESVPVLALIGQPPLGLEGRGAFQDSSDWGGAPNAIDLIKSTTKWAHKIERSSDFWIAFFESIRQSLSGRQGPVALLIPRDLFEQEVEEIDPQIIRKCVLDARASYPNSHDIDTLYLELASAKKPALVIGHGACRSLDAASVTEFALSTQIPTATTLSARQLMPNDATNYLGLVGAAGHPSVHNYLMDETDLIIAIGTGLSVMSRGPLGPTLAKKRIVAINVCEDAILRVTAHAKIIHADAGSLLKACQLDPRFKSLGFRTPSDYRRTVLKPLDAPYDVSKSNKKSQMRQSEAIALIEDILPTKGHILFDAGNCAAAALHWTHVPMGSTSTIALGMGTMGYAIGGAIGAQLGSVPGTRTVSIVGDGAFLMCGLEIHTAIELQLPILYVVFNNAGHGMCVTRQQLYFAGRQKCSTYHDFRAADVAQGLAGDLPCFVASVDTREDLEREIGRYKTNLNIPGVLEIRNYTEEWPPFAPFYKEVGPVLQSNTSFKNTLGLTRTK